MDRRTFVKGLAAAPLLRPSTSKITRIVTAPMDGRFHKFVTMNAYDVRPKGHSYGNTLVRIATNQGVEGIGVMGYPAPDAAFFADVKSLLGADPADLYESRDGHVTGRAERYRDVLTKYRHLEGPLFDLLGKLASKPVWRLIGPGAREHVEVYDGTLYFSDIWFSDRGVRAVIEEAEESIRSGYRGVKLKIGRGSRWMDVEGGLLRDIEVIHAVRKAVGPRVKVMVDANDGYKGDPGRAWRLIAETAKDRVHWLEELLPEDQRVYGELRDRMVRAGIHALIADGENFVDNRQLLPFLEPRRFIDVVQVDIRTGGFLDHVALAQLAGQAGGHSVPHNWGSRVGGLMGLQLSKAVPGVPAAEDDRSTCDVIVEQGYSFRNGLYSVPETPGMSIHIDEDVYRRKCKPREVVIE